jgi:hypothetical protein
VAEFAAAEHAQLLQIHPLEETGRARPALQGQAPTDVDAAVRWLLVDRLSEEYGSRLRIHLDFLNRDALRDFVDLAKRRLSAIARNRIGLLILSSSGSRSRWHRRASSVRLSSRVRPWQSERYADRRNGAEMVQ